MHNNVRLHNRNYFIHGKNIYPIFKERRKKESKETAREWSTWPEIVRIQKCMVPYTASIQVAIGFVYILCLSLSVFTWGAAQFWHVFHLKKIYVVYCSLFMNYSYGILPCCCLFSLNCRMYFVRRRISSLMLQGCYWATHIERENSLACSCIYLLIIIIMCY